VDKFPLPPVVPRIVRGPSLIYRPFNLNSRTTSNMVNQNNTTVTPRNSTGGGTLIQVSLPEPSTQHASVLLTSKDLVRNLKVMTPEDQAKFVNKVDQVRRRLPLFQIVGPSCPQRHALLSTCKI
jgi:hypothetical protein